MASQNLLNNFTAGMPTHHCTPSANHSIPSQYNMSAVQWHYLLINSTAMPPELNSSQETEGCLDGWTFDQSEFISTIVTEWDLVCSLRPMKQMSQTIYMGGVLAGAVIFGGLSDRFGRKMILCWSYLQLALLGSSTGLAPSYAAFCILRFLSGMAVSGVILNAVSLKVEWIPTSSRTLVGTLTSFFFTFGQMILAGLSYWLREWRKLQIAVCLPYFLFFLYSWWFSESARWLVLNRRSDEALKNIRRVARINGKKDVNITLEVNVYLMQVIFGAVDIPAKLVVYGGAAVIAGGFACFLPETLNIPLPDTIEDVEERWPGRGRAPEAGLQAEGVSLKEEVSKGGVVSIGGVVSKEEIALKEMKEGEGTGLNAL
ncbi:hypothetical protein CRUP_032719 [Coryphaenoides rupestris]|nr:hypothetical protein CRUP_032719 [Coryphaenoides rupestris]